MEKREPCALFFLSGLLAHVSIFFRLLNLFYSKSLILSLVKNMPYEGVNFLKLLLYLVFLIYKSKDGLKNKMANL